MSAPVATDHLSLTLPKRSKSRALPRKRRLPPNWKWLLAWFIWTSAGLAYSVFRLAQSQPPWAVFTGAGCVLDLHGVAVIWRRGGDLNAHPNQTTASALFVMGLAVALGSSL